jgi:beta-mannosidase
MVTVHASAYAKSVEIVCPDADVLFEDNFFDMNAGEKTVRVLRGQPGRLFARSVFSIR